jgi:hypothetical protein
MKKFTFLIFLSCISVTGRSQSLTNAQVYDFMPGDVFQWTHTDIYPSPPMSCYYPMIATYHTDSIISKTYSAASDTVFYTVHSEAYRPFQCTPGSSPTYSSSTTAKFYTNLTAPAEHYTNWSCATPSDTFYVSSSLCGKNVWVRHSNENSSCFEEPVWSSKLIEGCGRYINLQDVVGSGEYYNENLFYYRKNGVSCGTYYVQPGPMNVTEPENQSIALFPNPSDSKVYVSGLNSKANCRIFDLTGRTIVSAEIGSAETGIDISALSKGCYFLVITVDDKQITKQLLKN